MIYTIKPDYSKSSGDFGDFSGDFGDFRKSSDQDFPFLISDL